MLHSSQLFIALQCCTALAGWKNMKKLFFSKFPRWMICFSTFSEIRNRKKLMAAEFGVDLFFEHGATWTAVWSSFSFSTFPPTRLSLQQLIYISSIFTILFCDVCPQKYSIGYKNRNFSTSSTKRRRWGVFLDPDPDPETVERKVGKTPKTKYLVPTPKGLSSLQILCKDWEAGVRHRTRQHLRQGYFGRGIPYMELYFMTILGSAYTCILY